MAGSRAPSPQPAQTTTAPNKEPKLCKQRSGHAHLPPASTMDACGSRESCVAYNMQGMPRSAQLYSLTSLQVRRSQSWRERGEAHRQERHCARPARAARLPARLGSRPIATHRRAAMRNAFAHLHARAPAFAAACPFCSTDICAYRPGAAFRAARIP
jgi:hypothetical protein